MTLFYAHRAVGTKVPTYFIESAAPDNVDDPPTPPFNIPGRLEIIPDADVAINEIAGHLADTPHANLVVLVHGFNNPEPVVLPVYAAASDAIERDPVISSRPGLVCVGYRWPSEKMFGQVKGVWDSVPLLASALLAVGGLIFVLGLALYLSIHPGSFGGKAFLHVVIMIGWILAGLIITAILLRLAVYFRDNYRAQTYGAPDLIEIIRKIDAQIVTARKDRELHHDVQLSFIGHSMGGLVVTNAIRVLSDLFEEQDPNHDPTQRRPRLNTGVINETTEGIRPRASARIGHVFTLKRFLLASPDIPAEALLSNRANFLQASLLRFDEAYLFSNEGDEVLRQISTLANYFGFPTKIWKHGFRLGNVEILSRGYGVIPPENGDILQTLRVGFYTLRQLYIELKRARLEPPDRYIAIQDRLPKVFTYFDCTDYVDSTVPNGPEKPLLTFALRTKRSDPSKGLSHLQHLQLLFAYPRKVNVHGGYFQGELSKQLMYRLVCLGYHDTVAAYGGLDALSAHCKEKQIRVLLSPVLPPV